MAKNSEAEGLSIISLTVKNYAWSSENEKYDSKKLLRSNLIQKSSTTENFTVKIPATTVSPTKKMTAISFIIKSLTMKHPTTTNLTMKSPCIKVLLKKCLTEKRYTSKNWLQKFKRWIISQKNLRRKFLFQRENSQQHGIGRKKLTKTARLSEILLKKVSGKKFRHKKINGELPHSKNIQAENPTGMALILKSLLKKLKLRSSTATVWRQELGH